VTDPNQPRRQRRLHPAWLIMWSGWTLAAAGLAANILLLAIAGLAVAGVGPIWLLWTS